ncbi:MAG TPA: relaxase domain-containing protein, partial [Actinomycetota bacterium]|nr:relaxase domain-containing protein [Actinomycetota bacterium]
MTTNSREVPHVLNIGVLAPGAGEYYIGEVATSAEDYYSGRGETAGRWVGSLAAEIGLSGEVDSDAFRAVLAGRHPGTGEQLVQRNTMNRVDVSEIGPDRLFDVPEAAAVLGVSTRQVRRLLETGDAYRAALDAA